jgi:hypothetical protein
MVKNKKEDYILLSKVSKFYICGKAQVYKAVIAKKLTPKLFEGDSKMYVKRQEVEKLFKHRKTNKRKNDE